MGHSFLTIRHSWLSLIFSAAGKDGSFFGGALLAAEVGSENCSQVTRGGTLGSCHADRLNHSAYKWYSCSF